MLKSLFILLQILLTQTLFLHTQAWAGKSTVYPPELKAVLNYFLRTEYPEVINGKRYKIKARTVEVVDIDGNGNKEIFLVIVPHYRQSPTVLIFTHNNAGKLVRIKEGLAPGPLVPVTGDYIDSHTLRVAVDMTVKPKKGKKKINPKDVATLGLEQNLHVVAYKKFFHMDHRQGYGSYIDMTHHNKYVNEDNCEKFEFSPVQQIKSGYLHGDDKRKYLLVVAGNQLYLYRIDGFTAKGLLKKQLWISKLPGGFKRLMRNRDGYLGYITQNRSYIPIPVPK